MNKHLVIVLVLVGVVAVALIVIFATRGHKKVHGGGNNGHPHPPPPPPPKAGLQLPKPWGVYTKALGRYNLETRSFYGLQTAKTTKDALSNYLSLVYPAANPAWWTSLTEGQLRLVYSMLDWYYTPFVVEPKLPYPYNSVAELNKLTDIPNDRQRPLVGPYHDAYIQFFPMAATEPIVYTNNQGQPAVPGTTNPTSYPPASKGNLSWPTGFGNVVARPLMTVSFIAPYGRARQGFPSFAYVEATSYGMEIAGGLQRNAPTCWPQPYGNTQISSFDGNLVAPGSQEAQDAVKYAVAKPAEGVYGPGYMGTSSQPGAWGVEGFSQTPPVAAVPAANDWSDCHTEVGIMGPTSWTTACVCVPNRGGFRSLPNLPLPKNDCITCGDIQYVNGNKKPFNLLDMYSGQSGRAEAQVLDASGNKIEPKDLAYCPNGTPPNCNQAPYGLFYPQKGYGKFINLGRTALFFSYVHMMLTVHDYKGYGINFRFPFEGICMTTGGASGHNIIKQVQDMSGNTGEFGMGATDNRQYLIGWITVPKKGLFSSGQTDKYYDAIVNGGGGRLDFGQWGAKFTKGLPQVIFDADHAQKVWGKPLGCGQMRWQEGDHDPFTNQTMGCQNPWMNPMDDGGRLEWIGKNFVQFYCPPELMIKNPLYQQSMSKIFPQNFTPAEITAITGSAKGTGSTGNPNKDTIQEAAIRWVIAFYIYGDTNIQQAGIAWPFGAYSSTGTKDFCLYMLTAAMGWKSVVITSKPNTAGQPVSCEYPYYDSEILMFNSQYCAAGRTMQDGNCGPFGQLDLPSGSPCLEKGCEYARPYNNFAGWGPWQICFDQVTLDVTQNIERYLLDGFLLAFYDFSTGRDSDVGNKNKTEYNCSVITRENFPLNEVSSDIPAQMARKLFKAPTAVKFCYICPGSIPQESIKPTKPWKELTDAYKGKPALNSFLGEPNSLSPNDLYTSWKNSVHSSLGCYNL
jgi:hypothetical protein